jgi:hypothetical protein
MKPILIFWPMIAMAGLTLVVAIRMYTTRVAEMRERRVRPQLLATRQEAEKQLHNTQGSDNFRNLFEIPVLFYAICPVLFLTGNVTTLQLSLAWVFVLTRVAHSFIHVTYNKVMHRFNAFVLGMAALFAMWITLAVQLARAS